jgi:hypothetical protein
MWCAVPFLLLLLLLLQAGRCTAGECCDTKASKILPRGIVCR